MKAPALELGDIFRLHGPAYLTTFGDSLSAMSKEGAERDRGLPHGGPRRSRRPMRSVRLPKDLLLLVPQSPLPEVPWPAPIAMARATRH